ncbi:MAG: HAD hydrolase-like protein [Ignavibacteriae bacterium]|nr:HAD hydrolase-like protein [Ignavibacteriota bacterium]
MTKHNTRGHLRLVLFDIDGTLLSTNGVAKQTFAEAVDTVFGQRTVAREHDFAGKTDTQIYREILVASGVDEELIQQRQDETLELFLDMLEKRVTPESLTVFPGVRELLDTLNEETVTTIGLLTGNVIRGARIKLGPAGLGSYFTFGAFGSDAYHRQDLPSIAIERAYHRTGYVFREKEVVIVGDTPHDISCGRHLNVRTIAVATGKSSEADLAPHNPDYLFADLSDTAAVLEAIIE